MIRKDHGERPSPSNERDHLSDLAMTMTTNTQRTPDEQSSENALICEKLLGLTKHCADEDCRDWRTAEGKRFWSTPTFDNWADAGLALNALQASELKPAGHACESLAHELIDGRLTPTLVRAAALEYIRSLP